MRMMKVAHLVPLAAVLMVSGLTRPAAAQATWRLTAVLLIDQPAKTAAFWLHGRKEGTQVQALQFGLGNWDPRTRVTSHAFLPVWPAGWRFATPRHGGVDRRW